MPIAKFYMTADLFSASLIIHFKRIDNRVVLKVDDNVIWDESFQDANPLNINKVIPHRGVGTNTRVRIEIYNQVSGADNNPWSIFFQINSYPPVSVNTPLKYGNDNDLKEAWDYIFNWT